MSEESSTVNRTAAPPAAINPHVTICIPTCRRETLLEKLLLSLAVQRTDGLFTYSLVVVDNDAAGSAERIVTRVRDRFDPPIEYSVQPVRNIALTRNMAVQRSRGDYLAFIDDDEYADEDWLLGLFRACSEYRADVCHGPVIPYVAPGTSRFFRFSGMFERSRAATGSARYAYRGTGNCLIDRRVLAGDDQPFDPALGLTGGEDTVFFRKLEQQGRRFCWCDEARVHEYVPPERARIAWWAGREFRHGKQHVAWMAANHPGYMGYGVVCSALKFAVAAGAMPFTLPSLLSRGRVFVRCLKKICQYAGQVSAHFSRRTPVRR
jgi:glycosyltransferase involved in cell wall biosynthesis